VKALYLCRTTPSAEDPETEKSLAASGGGAVGGTIFEKPCKGGSNIARSRALSLFCLLFDDEDVMRESLVAVEIEKQLAVFRTNIMLPVGGVGCRRGGILQLFSRYMSI